MSRKHILADITDLGLDPKTAHVVVNLKGRLRPPAQSGESAVELHVEVPTVVEAKPALVHVKPVELPVEVPVEVVVELPVEVVAEAVVEVQTEVEAVVEVEAPVEVPATKPVEVSKKKSKKEKV